MSLERFAEWAYRDAPRRLVPAGAVIALGNSVVGAMTGLPIMLGTLRLSILHALGLMAGCAVLSLPAIWATVRVARDDLRRVLDWYERKTAVDAALAWEANARLVPRLIRTGVLTFSVAFLPLSFYLRSVTSSAWEDLFIYVLGIELLISIPAAMDYFALLRLLEPFGREIASYLPADYTPPFQTVPLRARLLLVIGLVTTVTALGISGFTAIDARPAIRVGIAIGVALAGTIALAVIPTSFLAASVTRPVNALGRAARRIEAGEIDSRVPLLAADEIGQVAASFNRMTVGLQQRAKLEAALGAYIDPLIAARVAQDGSHIVGEAVDVTVMFVDIVGFTRLAENADPAEVVADLNEFFNEVIPPIERNGGHANKLLGDGVMAVFGVPRKLTDHADRAFAAAREITSVLRARYGGDLRAGIGLNSGTVIVGSMGGGGKLDYTIIGDVVNVAARVEAYTRQTGDCVLITDATYERLTKTAHDLRSRGSHFMNGRDAPVALWTDGYDEAAD